MKLFDLERADDGITMWSIDFTRERGGPKWNRPKTQHWRGGTNSKAFHFRIGWRWTALGIHLLRQDMTPEEVEKAKADPRYSQPEL